MTFKNLIAAGAAVAMLVGPATSAFAQATGKENNATTGSEPGAGPKSGADQKGSTGQPGMENKGSMNSEMKSGAPTSAGTSNEQAKDLRGHSEMPTTGGK